MSHPAWRKRENAGFTLVEVVFALWFTGLLVAAVTSFFLPLLHSSAQQRISLQQQTDILAAQWEMGREVRAAKRAYRQGSTLYLEQNGQRLRFYLDSSGRLVRQSAPSNGGAFSGQVYLLMGLASLQVEVLDDEKRMLMRGVMSNHGVEAPFCFTFACRVSQ